MSKLCELLTKLAKDLSSPDNEILVAAQNCGDIDILNLVAQALVNSSQNFMEQCRRIEEKDTDKPKKESSITASDLEKIAAIADLYDGDPDLKRTADVLDMVLQNFSLQKAALDEEALAAVRLKLKKDECDPYKTVKPMHEKIVQSEEAKKLIADRVKHYRPQEHALQTRSCPDHPGTMPVRVADGVWQCSLDGKLYNYREGYNTLKGDAVPGGDVALQSQVMHTLTENTAFDSRDNRLNQ